MEALRIVDRWIIVEMTLAADRPVEMFYRAELRYLWRGWGAWNIVDGAIPP